MRTLMRQTKQQNPNKRPQTEERKERPALRKETKYGIIAIVLLACALLSLLSFMDLADAVGRAIDRFLGVWFGWGRYGVPLFFGVLAWMFWKMEALTAKFSNWIGFSFFLLSFTGLIHLGIQRQDALQAALDGRGGGYLGVALSYPLRQMMGPWATGVILACLFVVSLLLWFDTSLREMASTGNIFSGLVMGYRRFRERLKRGMVMRSIEDIDEAEDERITRKPIADAEMPSKEAEVAIEEAEERLKDKARASLTQTQPRLFKKIPQGKPFPIDLLTSSNERPSSGDIKANGERIQKTLATFGIQVEMAEVNVGPTVTQYTLRPSEGVKLAQITTLSNDLALALAAHPIRIEAPIPGKSLVGVEVPNTAKAVVKLREVLESKAFAKRSSLLSFALGKDVAGNEWVADLDRMPHMLIAGATGSGKSVCINTIILSLLYANTPETLRMIMVDPKRVELTVYNDVPHLLTPVITKVDPTINALRWVTNEMDRRFRVFEEKGKRNIAAFNETAEERLPYIVVIIDELADLMSVAAQEVEGAIIRLAQMARAVGIHLIVATQRPSVDVITGLIKANITARIAFSVASAVDSRTIIDTSGAEKLLGRGDMLFVNAELSKPKRLQGAFITDGEIEAVTAFVKQQGTPAYEEHVTDAKSQGGIEPGSASDPHDDDLYEEAKELVVGAGKASASYLQRRLRIGYARAARLLDLLEEQGVIGPGDGAKPRDVYISPMQIGGRIVGEDDESQEAPSEEIAEAAHNDQEEGNDDGEDPKVPAA